MSEGGEVPIRHFSCIGGVDFTVGDRLSYSTWASANRAFVITADLPLDSQTLAKHKDIGSTVLVKNGSNGELGMEWHADMLHAGLLLSRSCE